jgi:DNA gyrase/topoisomerase IV subunit A
LIITTQGKLIRTGSDEIRATGRSAQGVKLIDASDNDQVASASLVERQTGQLDKIPSISGEEID